MDKPEGEITKSLSRNPTRKEVLLHLYDIAPSDSYLTEISVAIDKHVSSVFRSMHSQGQSLGLIDLGLIEKNREYVRITQKGKEVVRYLRDAGKSGKKVFFQEVEENGNNGKD